jgi:hypothetical protein
LKSKEQPQKSQKNSLGKNKSSGNESVKNIINRQIDFKDA